MWRPIVGIGASAGGLEAILQLLRRLPAEPGLPIIVVQHLSPHHRSLLGEILQEATRMPVSQVNAEIELQANHVYVIPPDRFLEFDGKRLRPTPHPGSGTPHPIDALFRSLAQGAGPGAVGVVLSGTGSDGAIGVREIHAVGGIAIAQDPETSEHDGMPRAAIATGLVHMILAPEAIADQLVEIATHRREDSPAVAEDTAASVPDPDEQMSRLFALLRKGTGLDFSHYKRPTIRRRLQRRMLLKKVGDLEDYLQLLARDPVEVRDLHQDLLIQVTSFFREPNSMELLVDQVLPEIIRRRTDGAIRVWVPGCATGEEAYTVAIALVELLGAEASNVPVQIFATDVSEVAIERARAGVYPENIAADLIPERMRRFFTRIDGSYRVSQSLREICVFARQDLTRDPPFSRLDLIVCRNVLIYLEPPIQKKLMNVFHYALKPGGFLLLGQAETAGPSADLFAAAGKGHKLYTKKTIQTPPSLGFGSLGTTGARVGERRPGAPPVIVDNQLVQEARQLILNRYGPPGAIVDAEFQIVETLGQTSDYLALAPGFASLNLLKMARHGLAHSLRMAVHTARRENRTVTRKDVRVTSDGVHHSLNVSVVPLGGGSGSPYFLVLFETRPQPGKEKKPRPVARAGRKAASPPDRRIKDLERELDSTRQHMQAIIQDLEAANEELQSANEEILSSNEELQSTNEELNTAREELQSTNEEINTVNEELHGRNDELIRVNSDLTNLLASVQAAIVIVGNDLRIRRFTPLAERALNLISSDVGRPIHHIKPNIDAPDLEQQIRAVIDGITPYRGEVRDAQGRWLILGIRPYKDLENRIDGAVITLSDIDEQKRVESLLREEQELAAAVSDRFPEWIVVLDDALRIRRANESFRNAFQLDGDSLAGRLLAEIDEGWTAPEVQALLERTLASVSRGDSAEIKLDFRREGRRRVAMQALRVDKATDAPRILLVARPRSEDP